jgi:hypothetical protein
MKPFKTDPDGVPVFSTTQIDDYGFPEHWGYTKYRVVESREAVFVTDYKMEQERYFQKIHRYSRFARFKVCLLNILGERGKIPPYILQMIRLYLKPESMDKWNDTRKLLKHFKERRFYDQIPMIVKLLNYGRCFPAINSEQLEGICNDFKCLSDRFETHKSKYERKYFPNIRFVVLKLLELHDMKPNYPIPFLRTSRKRKLLDTLWEELANPTNV